MDKRRNMREIVEEVFEKMPKHQKDRFQPDTAKQAKAITLELKKRREEKLKNG